MKLTFFWEITPPDAVAFCSSDSLVSNGVSPLASILMDDGGIDLETSSQWIKEGIARASAIIAGSQASSNWSREAWGAELQSQKTIVYSLYDETCKETISTEDFLNTLSKWLDFVSAGPISSVVELNLSNQGSTT